jgi:low affinity Fe/Cu permease
MAMDQSATASRPGRSDKVSEGTKRNHALSLYFSKFAHAVAHMAGTPTAFLLAMLTIVMWAITGPIFGYSDTWQLVINTGTTIVTFLMVFMIQGAQNRDARAIHLKLDELIRSKRGARNLLVDLEHCTDEELAEIEAEFRRIRSKAGHAKDVAIHRGDKHLHGELHEIEQSARHVEATVKDTRGA